MSTTKQFTSRARVLLFFVVSLVVFALFLPALKNNIVNWDDQLIFGNPAIRNFPTAWKWAFAGHGDWLPLVWLSHTAVFTFLGPDPFWHHLVNVVLHTANTFLFILVTYLLVQAGIRSRKNETPANADNFAIISAVAAGLFFGLSPLRVESVVWISERKDVLFLFFGLLSTIYYIRYIQLPKKPGRTIGSYWASLFCFALSLMSKSMLVTLPIVFLLLDYYPFKRIHNLKSFKLYWPLIKEKTPYFMLSLVIGVIGILAQKNHGAIYSIETRPIALQLYLVVFAYIFYPIKTILPLHLAPFYHVGKVSVSIFSIKFALMLLLLTAVTIQSIRAARENKLFAVVWLFYLVTLLPVSGIIPFGSSYVGDRFTYYPCLGFAVLFGVFAGRLFSKAMRHTTVKIVMVLFLAAYFSAISIVLRSQIAVWKDSVTLWTHQITFCADKTSVPIDVCRIAYDNRGLAYMAANKIDLAINDFSEASDRDPEHYRPLIHRAMAYYLLNNAVDERVLADLLEAKRLGSGQAGDALQFLATRNDLEHLQLPRLQ